MYLEKVIIAKQELDALKPIEKGLEERVLQKMRLDWNYHSNSIEGNSLTYGETKSLILHHITADGKPLRDHFEITGHNEALLWVMDIVKSKRSINENFIRELHKLILKENFLKPAITPTGEATTKEIKIGEYKTEPNHVKTVTGEIFYFAEPHEVKSLMTDLLDWYNLQEKNQNINPIILATEFHYKFIRIHPFDDGNGRMARILMNFILMRHGYHPAIIKKETKENYFKALRQADAGNIEPFVNYVAESVYNSLILMVNAIKGLPFEDDNDVDKRFWMLEQKIKASGDEIKETISESNVLKIINNVFKPLYTKCELQNKKFKKYYIETKFGAEYKISGSHVTTLNSFLLSLSNTNFINTNEFDVNIGCFFENFNRKDSDNFYYSYKIFINFKKIKYSLIYDNQSTELNYDQVISEKTIDEIVNKITLDHINFIDQKLSNSTTH